MAHFQRYIFIFLVGVALCCGNVASAQSVTFNSPLVDAANRGDETSVLLMLGQGNSANVKGEYGVTPLMRAAYNGHLRIVKVLLGVGADVNAADIAGATALHLAARQGKQDVVDELLRSHADVNVVDAEGWTPLMRATLAKQPGIMRKLLDKGADPFKINASGEYALMYAVQTGSPDVVNVLVEKGVVTKDNPAVVSVLGGTAPVSAAPSSAPKETEVASVEDDPASKSGVVETVPPPVSDKPAFAAFEDVKPYEEVMAEEARAKELKRKKEKAKKTGKAKQKKETVTTAKEEKPALASKRVFRLQAGIYENPAEAKKAWDVFVKAYPKIFAERNNAIMQLTGGQGGGYTLVFGEFPDKPAAQKLCSNLWQKDIGCFVMETSLTLAQLEATELAPVQQAKKSAKPEPFNIIKALKTEAVQAEVAAKKKLEFALPPLPEGAELVAGTPWVQEEEEDIANVPDARTVDTAKVLAAGESAAARREMAIIPQEKPSLSPAKPTPAPVEKEAVIPVPNVEEQHVKKGKVEVAEAIRVQPGQNIVLPKEKTTSQFPDKVLGQQEPPAPKLVKPQPVSEKIKEKLLPQVEVAGEVESFWIQVGNFASQEVAVDFAKIIRQNPNFHGTRLRVIRLPVEAAKNEPDIAVRVGKFISETKAKTLCKSELSYLRCTVIHEPRA